MDKPLISIIIPIYNVSQYITKCLDSVFSQTYKNFEVILVDDCGTDDSMDIVREYLNKNVLLNVNIISHERNRGLSAARNTGLVNAKGEYVYFLDSDDSISDDCLSVLAETLKDKFYDVVLADYKFVGTDSISSDLKLPECELIGNASILGAYANGLWYVMAWNKLCRREFLINNGLFFEEGYLHEDVIWSFKLACKADSMYVVNKKTYNYLVRSSSIMTSMSIEKDVTVYLKAFERIIDFVKKENRIFGKNEYTIIEGKKCGIMYSLLQKKEIGLYNKYYKDFYSLSYISPFKAFRKGILSFPYLLRDVHYCMPVAIGRLYKRLFYNVLYGWRGKMIEGSVW